MQFYKTAITIRKELTIWLLKDFGTRRNAKSVNQIIKDITPEEQAQIDAIFARYGRTSRRTYQSEYHAGKFYFPTDKNALIEILQEIRIICGRLGIVINEKKTQIIKLKNGFIFLKMRYRFTTSGRVVITPVKATITRERRKLRKLKARLDNRLITKAEIEAQYKSWRGTLEKYDTYRRLRATDALYRELFKG